MKMRLPLAAIGVLCGCAACGFKGPLYLPQRNATRVTHPRASTAAPAAASRRKSAQKKAHDAHATPPP